MQRRILSYLRCPTEKTELFCDSDMQILENGNLITSTGRIYAIVEGIPILRQPGRLTHEDVLGAEAWRKDLGSQGITEEQLFLQMIGWYADLTTTDMYKANSRFYEVFSELFEPISGRPILDLCSGHGLCNQDMLALYPSAKFISVEYDFVKAQFHKRKIERIGCSSQVNILCADVFSLPFANETFERLVSYLGFNATTDAQKSMREAYRVLKTGAIGVTQTLTGSEDPWYLKKPFNTKEGYRKALEETGFTIEEQVELGLENTDSELLQKLRPEEFEKKLLLTRFRR